MTVFGEVGKEMRELSDSEWQQKLEALGDEVGYFERLGKSHSALLAEDGPVLLVSFEARGGIRARSDAQMPLGYTVAQAGGWSSLTLICSHDTWFRDPAVYAYFDRLVDEGFFEDFDRVVFYGTGPAGYAAAAFSVTAPGATVIAIQPQATLDPRLSGWDDRFTDMRRTSFSDRYGFAPDMVEGADAGYVIFDPRVTLDAMHAALFSRAHVTLLPCPNLGLNIERMLNEMDALEPILALACAGRFDAAAFWRLYRARRNLPRYLRAVASRLESHERPYLEALLCRNVARRLNGPRFRSRLTTLEDQLHAQGIILPEALPIPA